jgi:hypothetical protein
MPVDREIQNHFDAGDFVGGVRRAARAQIAEMKAAQKSELDLQLAALEQLVRKHPEIDNTFYGHALRTAIAELGLRGTTLEEMEQAFDCVQRKLAPVVDWQEQRRSHPRQTQPAPVQPTAQPPVEDPVTVEAKRLIAAGEITIDKINGLSANQYELASRDAVWSKAIEILFPPPPAARLSRGELALAAGEAIAEGNAGNHDASVSEKIRAMEEWKAQHFAAISTATPTREIVRSGITNTTRQIPLPRLATEALAAARRKQLAEDYRDLTAAEEAAEELRRYRAKKGNR